MKPFQNTTWLVAISTILFGQIYLRPFYSDFRFSMGVVVFGIFLLLYELSIKDIVLTISGILLFRIFLAGMSGIPADVSLISHYPAALFYLSYCAILLLLDVRSQLLYPLTAFIMLFFADSFSNWFELFLRGDLGNLTVATKAQPIFLTAILRSVLILIGFFLIKFYPEMFQKEAEKRKMATWILNQSMLYKEVIFINKSEDDIEKAMKKAHSLYRLTRLNSDVLPKQLDLSRKVLSISRDVHEIKKDYRRIRQALTSLIPKDLPQSVPTARELICFLCDDLEAYARSMDKSIVIERDLDFVLPEGRLFDYLSLINNLLVNAIEATLDEGMIRLTFTKEGQRWLIQVSDSGEGISEEDLSLIYDPGYSTKYDPLSGEMSTGLGLAQVHYIVNHILKGELTTQSALGKGTVFEIRFSQNTSSETLETDDKGRSL